MMIFYILKKKKKKAGVHLTLANNIFFSAFILRHTWAALCDIKVKKGKEKHKENQSEAIIWNGKYIPK